MTDQLERELRAVFEADARAAPGQVDVARAVAEGSSRRARARMQVAAVAVGLAAAAAIGVTVAMWSPPVDGVDPAAVPTLVEPTGCPDSALCEFGFTVADQWYSVSCSPVRPELITDLVAVGRLSGVDTAVRQIEGIDPAVGVAVRFDWCQDGGAATTSPWSLALLAGSADQAAVHEAVCASTLPARRALEGCGLVEAPLGWGAADWRVAEPPAAEDVVVELLVTEQACASGQSAEGRIDVDVTYGTDTISLAVRVATLDGAQECPGNPETPYLVPLDEPVGDRAIVAQSAEPEAE